MGEDSCLIMQKYIFYEPAVPLTNSSDFTIGPFIQNSIYNRKLVPKGLFAKLLNILTVQALAATVGCDALLCRLGDVVFRGCSRFVTLIYGANGSGKSAIVAALQICLGAKAKDTNRAKKLSDLIRSNRVESSREAPLVRDMIFHNEG